MVENLNLVSLISNTDIVIKFVLFLLFAASFISWMIIGDKLLKFRVLERRARGFEKDFWSGQELIPLYEKAQASNNNPMANVFVSAINEWELHNNLDLTDFNAKERLKERVFQAMMIAKSRAISKIEKNVSMLATVSSSAPFIGLFGTVWGIMNSFSAIAGMQNTSLAVVAPGISEALFATAMGLVAAIPALIFYNMFVNKLNYYNTRLEDFSVEILNLLSRELDKKS